MTNEQIKVNEIQKRLGKTLCQYGENFIKGAFKIKPVIFDAREVRNSIRDMTELAANQIKLADRNYYAVDWNVWRAIISLDWGDKKKYMSEKYDCDNFADYFAARAAYLFGLNSCAKVSGLIYEGNKLVGAHRFNIILTSENEFYLFEPITDGWIRLERQREGELGKWRYSPFYFDMN